LRSKLVNMKLFVKVDFWIQVILYVLLLLAITSYGYIGYFFILIGIWQLASAVILTQIFDDRLRVDYLKYTFIYLMILPVIFLLFWKTFFLIPIFIYSIGAFAFSIWYFKITYYHNKRLQTTFRSFWDLEI